MAVGSRLFWISNDLKSALGEREDKPFAVYDTTFARDRFVRSLNAARLSDTKNGWAVTPKSAEDLFNGRVRTFMNADGTAGFGLDGCDIVAVFKHKKNGQRRVLDTLMPIAIEQGGDRLDCYGIGLVDYYSQFGFIPVARVEFNPRYANQGWSWNRGTPYIYVMMHNGDDAATVARNIRKYPRVTDEQLNGLPTFGKDEYDKAIAFRDNLIALRNDIDHGNTSEPDYVVNREAGKLLEDEGALRLLEGIFGENLHWGARSSLYTKGRAIKKIRELKGLRDRAMRLAVTPEQSEQEEQDEQWMSYTDEGFDFSFGELLPPSPEEQIAADAAQAEAQDVDLKKTEDAMFEAAGEQNPYDEADEGTAKQETGSDARQGSQEAVEQGQAVTDAGEPANATEPVSEPTPAAPSQTEEPGAQTSVSAEEPAQPVAELQEEAAIQPTAEQQDSQKVEQAQEPAPEVAETAKPVPASADEANVETPELRERRARYTRLGYPEFLDAIYLDPKQKEGALNALELPWETDANGNVKTIGEAVHDDPNGFLVIVGKRNSISPPSEDTLDKKTVLKAKADAREYALHALSDGEEVEVDWRNFIPTEKGRSIPPVAALFAEFLSSPDPYSWLYREHSAAFKAYVDIQTAKVNEAISALNDLLDNDAIDEMEKTVDSISDELNSPTEMQSVEQASAEPAEQVEEVHQEEATNIEEEAEEAEEAEDEDERGLVLAKMVTEFERPTVDSVIKTLGFSLPEGWTTSRKEDLSATEDGYVITLTDSLSDKNGEPRVSLQTRISIEEAVAKESLRPDGYDVTVRSSIEGDGCSVVHSQEKTPYANILNVILQIPKIKKNKRNPGKSDIYELRRTTSSNNRVSTSVTANFDKMTMDDFQTKWKIILKRIGVLGSASEQERKSATKPSAKTKATAPETTVADEQPTTQHPIDGFLTAPNGTKNFGEIHVEGIPNGFVRMRNTGNLPEGIGFERKSASDAVIKKMRQFGFDSEGELVSFIADNIRAGFANKKDGSFILASTIVTADGKSRYIAITKAVFSNGIYTVVEEDIIDEKDFAKAYLTSYEPRFFSPAAGKVIENSPPPAVQAQETPEQKEARERPAKQDVPEQKEEEGAKTQTPPPVVDSSGIRVPAKRREIVTPDNAMATDWVKNGMSSAQEMLPLGESDVDGDGNRTIFFRKKTFSEIDAFSSFVLTLLRQKFRSKFTIEADDVFDNRLGNYSELSIDTAKGKVVYAKMAQDGSSIILRKSFHRIGKTIGDYVELWYRLAEEEASDKFKTIKDDFFKNRGGLSFLFSRNHPEIPKDKIKDRILEAILKGEYREELSKFISSESDKQDIIRMKNEVFNVVQKRLFNIRKPKDDFADTKIADLRLMKTLKEIAEEEWRITRSAKKAKNKKPLAPDNKTPSLLPLEQWVHVRLNSFKNWFGDWENNKSDSSKILDENGEPLQVFHGTREGTRNYSVFSHTGVDTNVFNEPITKTAFVFTPDFNAANHYSLSTGNVSGYFLNIRNPYYALTKDEVLEAFKAHSSKFSGRHLPYTEFYYPGKTLDEIAELFIDPDGTIYNDREHYSLYFVGHEIWPLIQEAIALEAKSKGCDGYVMRDWTNDIKHLTYGVFNRTAIKSSEYNIGKYGRTSVDTRFRTSEGDAIVRDAGRQPQPRQEGAVTDEQVNVLNQELFGIERKGDASGIKAEEFEAKLMEEVAHEMASSLNLSNIDIVTDASSLTGEKAEAKGWFDRTTGRITVVVPNHFDAEDVAKTVLHEAVAHYGLRRLFGEDFDSFLRNVILNSEPYIRARIERKAAVDRLNVMDAAEEVLAEIAQEMMNDSSSVSGTVKRFFARVRELLRAFLERITGGRFSIRYTENDLNAIIWNSYHNLIRDGVSTEATLSNADGNGSRFLYRTGDDPEFVEAAQKETDKVTDEAERNGTQHPRARFSLRSYAVAMMAHDKATGKKRDSEYWARVMAGLGLPVNAESFSELNKDAETVLSGIREKGENILSRSMNDIAREAEKEAFPRVVETLFGQFGRQFGKVGDRAQEGYNKVRISMEKSAPELTVDDMKATAGLDLVELLLSIPLERKGRRVKAKPEESRRETPEAEAVDAVSAESALEDGETVEEEPMPTGNDAEEKLNAALEAQINKVKAFRDEIIAELEKWRLKEQERRRLRAERAMARAAAEENKTPDEEDDDTADGEIGYDEAVSEAELSGSVPDFASLLEALGNIGELNLNNGAELSAVLRIWMEKLLGMDAGSSSDFGEGFAAYRKTLVNMLREAADKLIPISSKTESNTVRNLERQIAMLERSRTAEELERKTAMVLTKLLKAGDRASRKEQIASLRAELRRTADAGKAYDEMEKAMHRKVLGMHQRAATYISKILTWGEVRIEQEMERLNKIIEGRFEDYATGVGDAEEDAVVIWAQERLSALSQWGGMYRKAPAEIAAESQKILKWLNEERYAHEKKWSEWRERVTGIRTALIAALKEARKGRKQPSESALGSFADTLTATVRQRLEEMLVGSGASGQELIDEILYTLNSGSEQLAAIKTRWRREARTIMEDAVEGTGKSVSDLNRELAEKIPEALNDLLTTEDQPIQMNWNQCLQLYASLCQTASYADNIAKYGREGHRAAIEEALSDKPELLRLVSLMREAYAKRRTELSESFRAVTGNPIYSPDPFYMPVRMYLGGADATREGETHHAWMPFTKAFQPRVRNGRDFDLSQSLLGVWGKNTEDSACGIAFGLRGMELRSILFSPKTIEAMRQTIGRERTSKLLEQVTDTLMGGYKEPPNPVKDAIKASGSALTYSALSWNAVTMLKQMAGFTAWAEVLDGGYIELAKHIMSYDRAAARELVESDGFIARFGSEGFGKMLKDALTDTSHNWIMRMYHAGMTTVQLGDYVASIIVGAGVYKAKKLQLMRNGMSEEEAGRNASTVTWALIEECQQSSRVENTPRFLRRGGVMAASVLKFASSPLLQTSHEYHAGRMWLKASRSGDSQAVAKWRARFVNTVICNHILMPVFMYGMAELFGIAILGREPPEEEEVLGDIIMQCVAGPLNRIILAGMAVDWTGEAIARALGGEPNVYRDSGNGMAANAMFQRVGNTGKKLVADFANEEYELVRNDILDLLSIASRPASYIVEGSRNWSGYDKEAVRRRATYERKKRDKKQQEHDSLRSRNAG